MTSGYGEGGVKSQRVAFRPVVVHHNVKSCMNVKNDGDDNGKNVKNDGDDNGKGWEEPIRLLGS